MSIKLKQPHIYKTYLLKTQIHLNAAMVDNEKTILRIETFVASEEFAKRMQQHFNEKAENVYKGVMALLSGDVDFIFDE